MTLKVIHKQGNTALVKGNNGKSFPVLMVDWLKHLVCIGDTAIIKKNHVTGELMMTDYVRYIDNIGEDL